MMNARLAPLALILAACGGDRPSNQPSSRPAVQPSDTPAVVPSRRPAVVYACDPDLRFLAAHDSATDRISLRLPEGPVELDHEPAASGAKYASGRTVFWNKGDEVTLEHQGKVWQCRLNVRDTRIEALRSAGARFWATGNEPGWNLVVWPDSVVLVANYGEDTLLFPLLPPEPHPDTVHAAWNIQAGGRTLMLTILRQPCADDMSGEPWTHQVEYLLDSTRLRGCGKALY
jgi:uncharacterized membrane protein/membrane-bound inhibitor of C-type lysozyme